MAILETSVLMLMQAVLKKIYNIALAVRTRYRLLG
jgi:hypothetical protein